MTRPVASPALSHLRVLDLTRVRAGPTCCRILADFGADVIKIEAPPGVDPNDGISGARHGYDMVNLHRNKRSITLNLKESDGRAVFIMPWHGATMIGTTETPFSGDPAQVAPLPQEEEYLLAVARRYMTTCRALTRADITMRFAGLRVLPAANASAFNRSRETIYTTDRDTRPRVLGIYGGKLTGWRAAAAHVLERIGPSLPPRTARVATAEIQLRSPT